MPIHGLSNKSKARVDARTLAALARRRGDDPAQVKLAPWVNHDLRRVVRTNLAALDVVQPQINRASAKGKMGTPAGFPEQERLRSTSYAIILVIDS